MLSVAAKRAHYDEVSIERIRELMMEFEGRSHVAPTLSAYYQAIAAPRFCEEAAAASRRRLAKVSGRRSHRSSRSITRRRWKY